MDALEKFPGLVTGGGVRRSKAEEAPQVGLEPTTLRLKRGLPSCCWELRIVADSFMVLLLPNLWPCRIE
jgi:hypothetical protein